MFGLTKREQRWKAEQRAAEVLADLAKTVVKARAQTAIAEAQTDAEELKRVSELYEELLYAVGNKHPGETRHQTALRYIRSAERSTCGSAQSEKPNARVQPPTEAQP